MSLYFGLPAAVRDRIVREGLDSTSTRPTDRWADRMGQQRGARRDAAEATPPLLNALFAIDGRVRPFNTYLAGERREWPLSDPAWEADRLVPQLMAVSRWRLRRAAGPVPRR